MKSQLIGKYLDAGKDWRREEKEMTEDEIVGWHHWLDGHEFEQAQGVDDEQGSLACCSTWGHKELDTTEWLNWLMLNLKLQYFGHQMPKSQLIGKDPDAGKDWRQEEEGATEDETVRLHYWFNGHEFAQTLGDSEGQGSLVCCNPWGCKESDRT